MLFNRTNNSFSSAGTRMPTAPQLASQSLWSGPPGVDIGPAVADPFLSGLKRPSSEGLVLSPFLFFLCSFLRLSSCALSCYEMTYLIMNKWWCFPETGS